MEREKWWAWFLYSSLCSTATLCFIILSNYNSQGKGSKSGGQEAGVKPYLVPNFQPDSLSVSEYLG